jgi:hypothetical protein
LQATDHDADGSTFGFISSPAGRRTFETTPKFTAGAALSVWDTIKNETEISKQVSDNRVFAGVWGYLVIATWGAGSDDGDFAVDLTIDPFTQATGGQILITASMFCDVGIRWPALFSFTDANVVS